MFEDAGFVDHLPQHVVGQDIDLRNLVRCPEPVEEMQKRNARLQRGGVRDQRQILRFLHRTGAEHCKPGGARRHHIAVIAKYGKRLRRNRSRRNVKDGRRKLARDLVHVGDHQKQSLRRSEGGAQRSRLERTVNGACRTTFTLHLHHGWHCFPQIFHAVRRPRVRPFAHRRRRGDGINGDHFVKRVSNTRHGLVCVHCLVTALRDLARNPASLMFEVRRGMSSRIFSV
jgi:hypothetical protein